MSNGAEDDYQPTLPSDDDEEDDIVQVAHVNTTSSVAGNSNGHSSSPASHLGKRKPDGDRDINANGTHASDADHHHQAQQQYPAPTAEPELTYAQNVTSSFSPAPSSTHSSSYASTTATVQPKVADHYNNIVEKGVAQRQFSPIYGLKSYNNWVKSVLIKHYGFANFQQHSHSNSSKQPGAVVLDLCCGKGGDLKKFQRSPIAMYVGSDHAYQSLIDAVNRYNTPKPSFPALWVTADSHRKLLSEVLPTDLQFDLVSVQFALHYSFEFEDTARTFVRNISDRLVDGGYVLMTYPDSNILVRRLREAQQLRKHQQQQQQQNGDGEATEEVTSFGNSVYHVNFDPTTYAAGAKFPHTQPYGIRYTFDLSDAIDGCPEYLVHQPTLNALLHEHGIHLLHDFNLQEFFHRHIQYPEYRDLAQRMSVLSSQHKQVDGITVDEWVAIGLYKAVVYQKQLNRPPPFTAIQPATNDGIANERQMLAALPPRRTQYPHFKQLQKLAVEDICICLSEGKDICPSTHDVRANDNHVDLHHHAQHSPYKRPRNDNGADTHRYSQQPSDKRQSHDR